MHILYIGTDICASKRHVDIIMSYDQYVTMYAVIVTSFCVVISPTVVLSLKGLSHFVLGLVSRPSGYKY